MAEQMNWQTLSTQCRQCTRCGLSETRTHVVFGEGPLDAKILLVGEGPGQREDEIGRPFVGRSGQLLDTYLRTVGLSREENVFIANIVKCRPPQNRDPQPIERETCLPWLREQFRLLQPKIIVCLGRIAAQQLMQPDFSVTKDHGKFYDKKGVLFMATFHPAALLRNPGNKPLAFADFDGLRQKAQQFGIL